MSTRNYGTASNDPEARNGHLGSNYQDQEQTALLGKSGSGSRLLASLESSLNENVSKSWADLILIFCYIITGLLDSASVQVWGSFVSMQTGNTIYLGLGLAAPRESDRWIRAAISIFSFCLGSFCFGNYHQHFGARKRWVMVSTFILQMFFILAAALMITLEPKSGDSTDSLTIWIGLPIAFIAFQSGGQAYASRALSFGGLTSVVVTSVYCDLFSDQKLFTGGLTGNVERNRRAVAPLMILLGSFLGGLWAQSQWGLAGALWTAAVLKAFIVIAWSFWKADTEES